MKNKLHVLFGCLFALTANSAFGQGKLQVTDVSYPNPMDLNVGNVGEFVYAITNSNIGTNIDSILFTVASIPNIEYYPVSSPTFYLTDDTLPLPYNTLYTYPYPAASPHHNSYPLNLFGLNKINSAMIRKVLSTANLTSTDTLFLHIPFFVKNCTLMHKCIHISL